jgi:type I site-specific restriction-modification system R (restriction) subunit
MNLNESIVEAAALEWFGELGYAIGHGPQLAPGEKAAERESFGDVVLVERLREAIRRLNPAIPKEAREDALRKVLRVATPSLVQTNRAFHRMLRDGVPVEYPRPDGSIAGDHVRLVDFVDVLGNDWLVVNQFTVIEGQHNRRPDIVVFVNGLPLGLIELKNAADEDATIWSAYAQLQTYKAEIPTLLHYNAALVVSDGLQARIGSVTANQEWFKVWREPDGSPPPSPGLRPPSPNGRRVGGEGTNAKLSLELEVLVRGVFDRQRFLDLLHHFIVFEEDPDSGALHKIIAGYHQFHAVNAAVEETVRASQPPPTGSMPDWSRAEWAEVPGTAWAGRMPGGKPGDRRSGVVWHTQGSGKSFSMLFYSARIIRHPAMQNPTLVVLTDRNDLDDQLFGQFQRCHDILGQTPIQAAGRSQLRELLNRASGGVIFTTIHKFAPLEPSPPAPLPKGEGRKHYRGGFDFAGLVKRAREMRENPTTAEDMLWSLLRNRQLADAKFRRQHQFGEYIIDFFCNEAKLVVECDGESHNTPERQNLDRQRDTYLKSQGLTVLRFDNAKVLSETEAVLRKIADHLPSPPGRGAGGEGNVASNLRNEALSDRRNIIVIADEAHRSQYGFGGKVNEKTGEMSYGFASNLRDALPNASFIGFTGTPIEKTDANTRAVFGDYISIYDIQRAVADKATVPIYYESRISKLSLNVSELPKIDAEFEEITEGEELTKKEKLKTKWAALEALVGDPKRIALVAADLVAHFEKRVEAMDGKAMIVCMSRRICVDLYNALIELRPEWAAETLKVVMTGSADDGPDWQKHIRNKESRRKLANRFKDPKDPFRIVIVRDMWLTGFDAPCLHTMYADKPMQGHGLMQAIARVNRVFRDKPGGLVVDYLGLADQLKKALAIYTESGGQGDPTFDTAQAIAVMMEKYGVACDMLHGFNWDKWTTGKPTERLALIPAGQEHILAQDDGKKRWGQVVTELSRAFALCAASDEATEIRDDVSFFQTIQAALGKQTTNQRKTPEQIDAAIRQLVSKAIATDGQVIDVFTAAGLKQPDISILDDRFLAEIRGLKHKNVAAELLEKLLKDELKVRSKRNLVQSLVFSEKLKKTLNAYHNRAISTMEVIEELIKLAKEVQASGQRSGLTPDEWAFYDALATNDSAKQAMGDDKLKVIAAELITKVRQSVSIDWTLRESARAKIKVMVKRILNKHGYPPDLQEAAVKTVLAQAELLCAEWV